MKRLLTLFACLVCGPLFASGTHVLLNTTMGNIEIELNDAKAPITVANFLSYVNAGQYNGEIFHRIMPGFMVQGGGYLSDLSQRATRAPIINESYNGLKNVRGSIAMARTPDPNSATAQFFINLVDNAFLDYTGPSNVGYAVFGTVVNGMDAADRMAQVPTTTYGYFDNLPMQLIQINSAAQLVNYAASASVSGALNNQTVQGTLIVPTADVGKAGSIFVGAILPNGAVYLLSSSGWQAYDANHPQAFLSGALQSDTFSVVSGVDLSGLKGTAIAIGYGVGADTKTSLANMLGNGHATSIYTIH